MTFHRCLPFIMIDEILFKLCWYMIYVAFHHQTLYLCHNSASTLAVPSVIHLCWLWFWNCCCRLSILCWSIWHQAPDHQRFLNATFKLFCNCLFVNYVLPFAMQTQIINTHINDSWFVNLFSYNFCFISSRLLSCTHFIIVSCYE